ncbi:MAG: dihydropteroate synthase [Thermodesulfobacteriota bacterium]
MARIGVNPAGIRIMAPKLLHYNLKLEDLSPAQANIIKQDMLSIGGEAAVSSGTVSCSIDHTGALVSGTARQVSLLVDKLRGQSMGLGEVASAMEEALRNAAARVFEVKGRSRAWTLGARTLVMGVVNVTPDSFSDGGRLQGVDAAVAHAMGLAEHADWIDVGGESTRPGAEPVDTDEELGRVVPLVRALADRGVTVSVDTTKAEVARQALEAGAEIINDVSALGADPEMGGVCAGYGAAVILMHMRGTPRTMQDDTAYEDLTAEVFRYLHARMEFAVSRGIEPDRIIIDPGLGFGKSPEGNIELLANLAEFRSLGRPILVGPSRKSFIGALTGDPDPLGGARLFGTASASAAAALKGAHIVRVHDAREARAAVAVADAIRESGQGI